MSVLRGATHVIDDDEAIRRLLARVAKMLNVDPAIFEEPAQGMPGSRVIGSRSLDTDLEAVLDQVPDQEVQARLGDLLQTLSLAGAFRL